MYCWFLCGNSGREELIPFTKDCIYQWTFLDWLLGQWLLSSCCLDILAVPLNQDSMPSKWTRRQNMKWSSVVKPSPELLQDWAILLSAIDLHSQQSFGIQPPLSFSGLFELLSEAFHCLLARVLEQGNVKLLSLSYPSHCFLSLSLLSVATRASSCLLEHSLQIPSAPEAILSTADTSHSHIMIYQKKHVQMSLSFFSFCFFETLGVRFSILFFQYEKNHFFLSRKIFDFDTALPPVRKDTTNNTGMRFMINEEGHRAENTSYCPSGFNPLGQARENILALNIICSHCN